MRKHITICVILLSVLASVANANILGSHNFTWWDDPVQGVIVTAIGAPNPTGVATALFDVKEWHLDQAQTTTWYNGGAVAGLSANPFNAANRNGTTAGSILPAVAGAEAFIYEVTNTGYVSGNGPVGPFTFTDPVPPGPGTNDLSGMNIIDTHGALLIAAPVVNSQFMATVGVLGTILDTTAGHPVGSLQDWDFNAYAGGGNFEWDIPNEPGPVHPVAPMLNRPGILAGGSGVFGYAMPGNWLDAVNDGWAHSWTAGSAAAGPSIQVNIANAVGGWSGPVPEPATLALLGLGALLLRRRKH